MNKKMRELFSKIQEKKIMAKEFLKEENKDLEKAKSLLDEAEELKKEFEIEERLFEEAKSKAPLPSAHPGMDNPQKSNSIIKGAIYPGETYKSSSREYFNDNSNLDFGKIVKGLAIGKWDNADNERNYISKNMTANGSILIPTDLSDKIIDMARAKSAIWGNIPIVPMMHNNLTIAVQTGDPEAFWVKEGNAIPDTDIKFSSVSLKGKTIAMWIPVQDELLQSALNITEQLINSVTRAMAVALDKAMLYGNGVTDSTEEIKGLTLIDDINKVQSNGLSYDFVVQGTSPIRRANLEPTNIVYNTTLADDLNLLKSADGEYILRPSFCDKYKFTESNNIKDNHVLCYDMNSLVLGIHEDMRIEWGYINDQFKRIQRGLRVYMRCDFIPVRPKGVSLVTINKS